MSKVLIIRSNVYPSGMSSLKAGRTLDQSYKKNGGGGKRKWKRVNIIEEPVICFYALVLVMYRSFIRPS